MTTTVLASQDSISEIQKILTNFLHKQKYTVESIERSTDLLSKSDYGIINARKKSLFRRRVIIGFAASALASCAAERVINMMKGTKILFELGQQEEPVCGGLQGVLHVNSLNQLEQIL